MTPMGTIKVAWNKGEIIIQLARFHKIRYT